MQKEGEIFAYSMNGAKDKNNEQFRTDMSVMIAQRNLIAMLENLPMAIQAVEDTIAKQKEQGDLFKKSQE
jgi:hypothetical protein